MKSYSNLKLLGGSGITVIVVNNRSVLLLKKALTWMPFLKRTWIPFIVYPPVWSFLEGKKETDESCDEAAYREVYEETKLERRSLKLVGKYNGVMKIDERMGVKYLDTLYVFSSSTRSVKTNFENSGYRWASLADIRAEHEYTNVFADKRFIERTIRSAIDGKKLAKG